MSISADDVDRAVSVPRDSTHKDPACLLSHRTSGPGIDHPRASAGKLFAGSLTSRHSDLSLSTLSGLVLEERTWLNSSQAFPN